MKEVLLLIGIYIGAFGLAYSIPIISDVYKFHSFTPNAPLGEIILQSIKANMEYNPINYDE